MPFDIPGAGNSGSICSVSPSDLAGQVDNLLSRIDDLEQTVAELLSQNVSANQLSDLSRQAGWLTGVTYLGVEGWTQTAAGTLIPPVGLALSSVGILPGGAQTSGINGETARLHKLGSYFSNITASTYITIASSASSAQDVSRNASGYLSTGTDGDGQPGWKTLVSGIYAIELNIEIDHGTATPTTGDIYVNIMKKRTGFSGHTILGYQSMSIPAGGWSEALHASIFAKRKFLANDYINVLINNGTDGDVVVNLAEMVAVYIGST